MFKNWFKKQEKTEPETVYKKVVLEPGEKRTVDGVFLKNMTGKKLQIDTAVLDYED